MQQTEASIIKRQRGSHQLLHTSINTADYNKAEYIRCTQQLYYKF